ncbi:MAG: Cas10/Cmr2 second palm domain-containing protein [Thermoanaerobaculia bacterium]
MPKPESFTPLKVEEIARRALAASAGVAPEKVPERLSRAVATGEGDCEEIAGLARALGPEASFDLVRFDTDRIAGFVFESSRPPVIAGASKILRDLNSAIARDFADWTLLSGGGEGLLLAPRGSGADICRRIEEAYQRASAGALGVTTAWIAARPEDFLPAPGSESEPRDGSRVVSGTPALLSLLHDEIRKKKDGRLPDRPRVVGNRPRCRSCRDREAGATTLRSLGRPDEEGAVCDPCARRWRVGQGEIEGLSFEELIEHWTGTREEASRKESYLGFLYADGNGMGALFGKLRSLGELQTLSGEVTGCFESLRAIVEQEVRAALPEPERGRAPRLFLDLLAGGDEVIWILPAALAVHVAERLETWLAAEVAARAGLTKVLSQHGREKLSIGIGLALCGLGYPVRYQYQLAKALQKSAKDSASGLEESTLDFELLTDSSPLTQDFKALRGLFTKTLEKGFIRTCRPYGCGELTDLRRRIEGALDNDLAISQLYGLAAGSQEGRLPFLNLLRYQIARKPAGERYQAWLRQCEVDPASPAEIERFFIHTRGQGAALWIQDALDLLPFLEGARIRLAAGRR